jgi:hypothetical protein
MNAKIDCGRCFEQAIGKTGPGAAEFDCGLDRLAPGFHRPGVEYSKRFPEDDLPGMA